MGEEQKDSNDFPRSKEEMEQFVRVLKDYETIIRAKPLDTAAESEAWDHVYPLLARFTNNFSKNMDVFSRAAKAGEDESIDLPVERYDFLTGKYLAWMGNDRTTDSLTKLRDLAALLPPYKDSQNANSIWQHFYDEASATSAVYPSGAVQTISKLLVKLDKLQLTTEQTDWRKSFYNTMINDLNILERKDPAEFNRLTKEFLQAKTGDQALINEIVQKRLQAGFDNDFLSRPANDAPAKGKKDFSRAAENSANPATQENYWTDAPAPSTPAPKP